MRAAITILAVAIGLAFVVATFINSRPTKPAAETPVVQAERPAADPLAKPASATPAPADAKPAADKAAEKTAATPTPEPSENTADKPAGQATEKPAEKVADKPTDGTLTLPFRALGDKEARVATIGSNDPKTGYKIQADLSAWGASVLFLSLTDYHTHVDAPEPFVLQHALPDPDNTGRFLFPFAANSIEINGNTVDLVGQKWTLVEPASLRTSLHPEPGAPKLPLASKAVYSIDIADALGTKVLTLTRTYTLVAVSSDKNANPGYELRCDQRITNHTTQSLKVVWHQNAQADLPNDDTASLGSLSFVGGYHDLEYDPKRTHIFTTKSFLTRTAVLDTFAAEHRPFWPIPELKQKTELVWLGSVNRYFAVVTHRTNYREGTSIEAVFGGPPPTLQETFPKQGLIVLGHSPGHSQKDLRAVALTLTSNVIEIAPGKTASLDLSLFAGPRKPELLSSPPYDAFAFDHLIVYALGCTWCTFQPLAKGLLWFLKTIHGWTHDWSLAIIALVIVVRLILHPITKRSQINMAKMSKQMASLQPELEKIKKKYKDEPDKLNSETLRLYREKNISYSGMLGCLPMLLQAPIWIAFYAMIYFAIELRHQPAFYGVFQAISGGNWAFLKDLSASDNFYLFSGGGLEFTMQFIGQIHITGINVIPLLLGVVFYFQQKLTMPPAQTEQQKQQQGIMKWMTVLFPFMLYTMPAGLTLYMCASTGAGIVDSLIVKRHIKREEDAGRLFAPPPPPKPGTLAYRWAQYKEDFMKKAQAMQEMQEQQKKNKKK